MTFSELNISTPLLKALDDLGYDQTTPIQEKVFSVIMSGKDVVGIAQTGTGKTLAYLLPCLRQWTYSKDKFPQILVIVPTRELVVQVVDEAKKLTPYMNVDIGGVYGGENIKTHMALVDNGLDVLVATPGRLLDLVLKGTLKLKAVKKLVIDEVDEVLDLGFRYQVTTILNLLPRKRQNILFSATITDDVELLSQEYFNSPIKIEAEAMGTPLDNITQFGYHVPNYNTKINLLALLLVDTSVFKKVLVFTGSKKLADQLYQKMEVTFGEQLGVIHSNKAQNLRFETVDKFEKGKYRILIATDLIARGLDISEVSHVINFDTPEAPEAYVHRIGRTGRADKKGIAISFISPKEREKQTKVENFMNHKIEITPLPEELIISNLLLKEEMPKVHMKTIFVKLPDKSLAGPAFHEKKEKNKKVNLKVTRAQEMRMKYKKPKTKGNN